MATYTAGDQINRALRLLGVLAEGETASADTANDALVAFDQMVDSWNTERLSVFSTQDQIFNWPAGEIKRTLGPSGDFVGNRPILFDDATYYKAPSGVSYGIKFINQQQYDGIAVKTTTSTFPQVIFVNSGSDLFHEDVPDEFIDKVFAVMRVTPRHFYLLLTKRPERMLKYLTTSNIVPEDNERRDDIAAAGSGMFWNDGKHSDAEILIQPEDWPFFNVGLGVSVEDQKTADLRIPLLLQTPAVS